MAEDKKLCVKLENYSNKSSKIQFEIEYYGDKDSYVTSEVKSGEKLELGVDKTDGIKNIKAIIDGEKHEMKQIRYSFWQFPGVIDPDTDVDIFLLAFRTVPRLSVSKPYSIWVNYNNSAAYTSHSAQNGDELKTGKNGINSLYVINGGNYLPMVLKSDNVWHEDTLNVTADVYNGG